MFLNYVYLHKTMEHVVSLCALLGWATLGGLLGAIITLVIWKFVEFMVS